MSGFLLLGLFIALIVGLVKPKLILRWSDKPTRLKIFGYCVLTTIIIGIIGASTENEDAQINIGR